MGYGRGRKHRKRPCGDRTTTLSTFISVWANTTLTRCFLCLHLAHALEILPRKTITLKALQDLGRSRHSTSVLGGSDGDNARCPDDLTRLGRSSVDAILMDLSLSRNHSVFSGGLFIYRKRLVDERFLIINISINGARFSLQETYR